MIATGAGIAVVARSLLGQSIGLADGRIQVDGQRRMGRRVRTRRPMRVPVTGGSPDRVDGDTEKSIIFTAKPDLLDDDGVSVRLTFDSLSSPLTAGSTAATTVSIKDDEVSVSFESASHTVDESDDTDTTGTREDQVAVKVTLNSAPGRSVDIPILSAGQDGATGDDFSISPTTLTFGANNTEKTITFTATGDTQDDDDESVKLTFGDLPAGGLGGVRHRVVVVEINHDDHPVITVEFDEATYEVEEGEETEITVTLSAPPERAVTILFSRTNDTASNADYNHTGVGTSVAFGTGDTEKTITLTATDDRLDEDFRKDNLAGLSGLFLQVLALCQ